MTSSPSTEESGSGTGAPPGSAAEERRLHPAGAAIIAIRGAGSAWFVAVGIIAGAGPVVGVPIVLALGLVILGGAYLEWRVTRYAVVDGGLRYRSGLLARKELDVPASRISALDTTRGILQRIFGVVALQVQTPGGGGKPELVLHAVSLAEAERLRHALGHRGADRAPAAVGGPAGGGAPATAEAGASSAGASAAAASHRVAGAGGAQAQFVNPRALPEEEAQTVFRLGPRELLLAGATSPSGALIGAMAALLYGPVADLVGDSTKSTLESGAEDAVNGAPVLVVLLVIVALVVFSILGTVLAFAGFQVTRDDRRLRVKRGLLTERTGTVQLDRIHALRIVETPIRQLLGYVSVEAEVAGWAAQDDGVKAIAPFVRRADLAELLPQLVPGYSWPQGALEPPPRRAMRRYVVRSAWFPAAVAVGLVVAPLGWWRLLLAAVLLGAGVALGVAKARAAGWRIDDRLLVVRSRGVARQTVVALVDRLQLRGARTSPFQRRANLAALVVRLSSRRTAEVAFLDAAAVMELLGRLRPRVAAVRGGRQPRPGA